MKEKLVENGPRQQYHLPDVININKILIVNFAIIIHVYTVIYNTKVFYINSYKSYKACIIPTRYSRPYRKRGYFGSYEF